MRHRGAVFNGGDFQANTLQGADGGFATGAGTLHADFDFAHAVGHSLAGGILGDLLGSKSCALARTLETDATGAGPSEDVPVHVGDVHLGVVESGEDVGDASADVLGPLGLNNLLGVCIFTQQLGGGGSNTCGGLNSSGRAWGSSRFRAVSTFSGRGLFGSGSL